VIVCQPLADNTSQTDKVRHLSIPSRHFLYRLRGLLCALLLAVLCSFLGACSDYNDARSAYAAGRHDEAFTKLLKLAKDGHLKAQYEVAMMFNNGIGVAKDKEEAWNWFIRAAKGGNVDAQVELGAHYEAGADGQPNGIMAAQWWKIAAKNGSGVAAFNLGTMYRSGRVTARDLVRAYAWFMVAEDLGVITAKDHLRNLRDLISEQDVTKAERLKDDLMKDDPASAKG
jgi:hypothetical protein